ncbi:MAG TPA: 2-amino-4-hydroxy-6-hydroxymethyldihydropteridine diphosphokinase [Sphingobacteriaceae bacterium]|nr:2-amino-4-hydroxy-6-hydroxymethyldihydropteridine diphosphokinase [Sphingobacteriaceae bacterium]
MQEAYLLLGSNLGNREYYISEAVELLNQNAGLVKQSSSYYETASWGKTDQPDFINMAVYLHTLLPPEQLLITILDIEKYFGRERTEKWGSRTIDIDILFYADWIIEQPDLVVPHPYLQERAFALIPMAEIAPDYKHPVYKKTILELCESLVDNLSIKKLEAKSK